MANLPKTGAFPNFLRIWLDFMRRCDTIEGDTIML